MNKLIEKRAISPYINVHFFVVVAALVQEPRKRGPGLGTDMFGNCTLILFYKKVFIDT